MNANLSLKSIKLKPFLGTLTKRYSKHLAFAVLLIILLCYIFVVFRINSLASAEPDAGQQVTIVNSIPKIDKNAVNQIQSLEQSNTDVHALFEHARDNPFQE
jgi:predicted PurR-regulated permease PerM